MKRTTILRALSALLIAATLLNFSGCAGSPEPYAPGGTNSPTGQAAPVLQMASVNLMSDVKPSQTAKSADGLTPEATAAAADFALRLFRTGSKPGENTLLSPISVLCALAMTANGAKGDTRTQMESTLGLPRELANEFFRAWLNALAQEDDGVLHMANSIWFTADSRFTVNRAFLQTNADYYGADAFQAPFDDTTLKEINEWVKQKTDGMIPEVLDEIPPDAVMYLVNALAFDAKWAKPYTKYAVQQGVFHAENGEQRSVEFMHSEEHAYLESEKAVGFLKYYKGNRYAFAALLPKEGLSVEDCLASLDGSSLQAMLSQPRYETVYASLPKFESDWSGELSELLKEMGMTTPFDHQLADFSNLGVSVGGNIFINRVIHKTYISVAEEGTRAGASTVVEMTDETAAMDPKQIVLDRPFIYLLVDCQTGVPLFIGTMLDPAQ